jgi:hypothetical protein
MISHGDEHSPPGRLARRELLILRLVAEGKGDNEVAETLCIGLPDGPTNSEPSDDLGQVTAAS